MHTDVSGEADPCDRPQKMRSKESVLDASCNSDKEADSGSRQKPICKVSSFNASKKAADPHDRPKLFLSHCLPIYSVDLTGDGKQGYGFTSADELEEVDIGLGDKARQTFISKKLDPSLREPMIALLKEYSDCFSWDYTEMPGLDRSIIEHRLPLEKGFWLFQQRARQMKPEVQLEVKKEIEKMLAAGFISPCRYVEWISNVVHVQKKDGRWRVCVDFRDLNRATPKDEYPISCCGKL